MSVFLLQQSGQIHNFVSPAAMPVQFTHPRKTFSALLTLKRTVRLVQSAMVSQAARVRKLFTACGTVVSLCAGMCTVHVFLHVVQSCKSFSADQAHILSCVHATVISVLATSEKLLSADGAVVRFLAGMVTSVFQKFPRREELLRTYVTDERAFACVLTSVLCHRADPGKPAAADVTMERTFTGVRAPVLCILFSTYK